MYLYRDQTRFPVSGWPTILKVAISAFLRLGDVSMSDWPVGDSLATDKLSGSMMGATIAEWSGMRVRPLHLSLNLDGPAVNEQFDASDVACVIGGEKYGRLGNFCRLAHTAKGHLGSQLGVQRLFLFFILRQAA